SRQQTRNPCDERHWRGKSRQRRGERWANFCPRRQEPLLHRRPPINAHEDGSIFPRRRAVDGSEVGKRPRGEVQLHEGESPRTTRKDGKAPDQGLALRRERSSRVRSSVS